jgi:hypothetical protein
MSLAVHSDTFEFLRQWKIWGPWNIDEPQRIDQILPLTQEGFPLTAYAPFHHVYLFPSIVATLLLLVLSSVSFLNMKTLIIIFWNF